MSPGEAKSLALHAPAKVNLFLRILAREESGYHQLETLLAALAFGDTLHLRVTGGGISLHTEGAHLGPPEENLVYRAAREFLARAGGEGGVEIRLEKRIPVKAGLGGGSSDAGATLRGLRLLFPGRVSPREVVALAGELGADVPFFLSPTPLALGWGRGDRLFPLPPLPPAPVLLALPVVGVQTREAYRLLAGSRAGAAQGGGACLRPPGGVGGWEAVAQEASNDFEAVILRAYPLLAELRESLRGTGARLSLLAGSGSALFAVYRERGEAEAAREELQGSFPDTRFLLTSTLDRIPDPFPELGVEP